MKSQAVIRSERFPHNDTMLIRSRNMRLRASYCGNDNQDLCEGAQNQIL